MLPDKLLEQINELAEVYAKAQTCRTLARIADHEAERANLAARADFWDAQVSERHAKLTVALNTALPPTIYAAPDPLTPVRAPDERQVEVRGSLDGGARAVGIRFTAAQAIPVAVTMIACAAAAVRQSGGRMAEILPPIPPSPPGSPIRPA